MTGWGPQVGGGGGGGGTGSDKIRDDVFTVFNEALAVPAGVVTPIFSYVVPADFPFFLVRVEFGGSNIGDYELRFGSTVVGRRRTWHSGPFHSSFEFSTPLMVGLPVPAGTVIRVFVSHGRPWPGDSEVRMQGVLVDTTVIP
jgi:hypothetical protein